MTETPQEIRFEVELPPEAEAGTFADFTAVWHTATTFVLDFIATKSPPQPRVDPETEQQYFAVPAKVVSRIRIPPQQVIEIAKALAQQLDAWEQETGQQPPPEDNS